ncbi:hypothetical protein [Deinococcus sp.]|uniref:hypothetical protein n=1 Tax=Deinococcus sp. TaxID=47478 RepID=UPI003C7DFC22
MIVNVIPASSSLSQSLRLLFDGAIRNGYDFRNVFVPEKYVWDPYFGSEPILLRKWMANLGEINPGAKYTIVASKK